MMIQVQRILSLIATCLTMISCLVSVVLAAELSGPVTSVLDGETIEVLNGHHADRIRLSGIDCPENRQAYSKKAKQAASALAFGKEVTVQTHGYDKYKRGLADVILADARTSIMSWSSKAGAGGIGSTRQEIQS